MGLKASTIRTMHEIAGEERHSSSRLWMLALQAQSFVDPSLWVRRVDIALIGGDPILLSRRICQILKNREAGLAPRIAIIHPGEFSGAPLAALEDPAFRKHLGLATPSGIEDGDVPAEIIRNEVARAAGLLSSRGSGGVLAFEMVQGLKDEVGGDAVLRMTRKEGLPRRDGIRSSAMAISQIEPSKDARGSDLYMRSERLFKSGLSEMKSSFSGLLSQPPGGRRFADLIIAKRCELLSGFISPPRGRQDGLDPSEVRAIAGMPYYLAGPPPRKVSQAITFWRQDFARATNDPI
jgi:hypothetical protein